MPPTADAQRHSPLLFEPGNRAIDLNNKGLTGVELPTLPQINAVFSYNSRSG